MSDGAESNAFEVPQAEVAAAEPVVAAPVAEHPVHVPATAAEKNAAAVEKRGNIAADAERRRQRQALELQRERILSERTASPHRRSALAMALTDIEEKLTELGWTIHL